MHIQASARTDWSGIEGRGPSAARAASSEVKQSQLRRVAAVADPAFLDRVVRPHLQPTAESSTGTSSSGAGWETTVIQLDGSGAATVRITLDGGAPVFAKVFPGADGPAVHDKLRTFRDAGFGAGARYQTVEPLGWYAEADLLLCRGAAGTAVSDLYAVDSDAWRAGVAESGTWLGTFHASSLAVGRAKSLLVTGELTSLAKRLTKVAARYPDQIETALGMLEVLDELTLDTVDGLLAQSHGQYRPIHVFVAPDRVTVIDLDRSGPADPARDVAEYLHRMRKSVYTATGSTAGAEGATRDFLEAYARAAGSERYLANLRFHWARYILHSLNKELKYATTTAGASADYRSLSAEFTAVATGRVLS